MKQLLSKAKINDAKLKSYVAKVVAKNLASLSSRLSLTKYNITTMIQNKGDKSAVNQPNKYKGHCQNFKPNCLFFILFIIISDFFMTLILGLSSLKALPTGTGQA